MSQSSFLVKTRQEFQDLLDEFKTDYYNEAYSYVLKGGDFNDLYYTICDRVLPYHSYLEQAFRAHGDVHRGREMPSELSEQGRILAGAMGAMKEAAIRDAMHRKSQQEDQTMSNDRSSTVKFDNDAWLDISEPKQSGRTSRSERTSKLAKFLRTIDPGYFRIIWYDASNEDEMRRDQVAIRAATLSAGWITEKDDQDFKIFKTWTERDNDREDLIGLAIMHLEKLERR